MIRFAVLRDEEDKTMSERTRGGVAYQPTTPDPDQMPPRLPQRGAQEPPAQREAQTEVNITVPSGGGSTGQPSGGTGDTVPTSWTQILSRGLTFGGPAVVILLMGMMIMSPRGQEYLFGVKPVDVQAVVAQTVDERLKVITAEGQRDRDLLRAEIDKERQLAAQERSRDRDVWALQLQGITQAIDDIRIILRDLKGRPAGRR
jgi:hypothetical protein